MTLELWEFQRGDLVFGGLTGIGIAEVSGLGIADLRYADQARLRRHGYSPGEDFLGGRTVTLELECTGLTAEEFADNMEALTTAFTPGQPVSPLYFRLPGVAGEQERLLNCRTRRFENTVNENHQNRHADITVELFAPDPLIYDTFETTVSRSGSGTLVVTNEGNFATQWVLTFSGALTNPKVDNGTDAVEFVYALLGGKTLLLDSDTHTAYEGTTSKYDKLKVGSAWFELPPGETTLNVNGTASITFRSAWWR